VSNRNREEFADPADLPAGIHHCTPTAYNRYRCRCRYCTTWSRLDSKARYVQTQAHRVKQRDGARDYLANRGVQVFGPGPFRKNPIRLAELVAGYFGDDIRLWVNREDTTS
jgi:hypothetical protein